MMLCFKNRSGVKIHRKELCIKIKNRHSCKDRLNLYQWLGSEHEILRRRLSNNPDCWMNRGYLCQNHTSCHEKCPFPSKLFFSFPEVCVVDKSLMSDWKCKCREAASPFPSDRSKSLFFFFFFFDSESRTFSLKRHEVLSGRQNPFLCWAKTLSSGVAWQVMVFDER